MTIHKHTWLLLFACISCMYGNAAEKNETPDGDCPPDRIIPAGSFDTETWTYTNREAGIQFHLPEGWYFSAGEEGGDPLRVGDPLPDPPLADKDILLKDIAYDWGDYNYMLEAVLPYFRLKGNAEGTEEAPLIEFGISYLPTGDLQAGLTALKIESDKNTEKVNQDIDRIKQLNDNPDLYPPYIFDIQVKKDFPVGREEWICVEIKSNGGEDIPLRNIFHAMKKVGCYNVVIRIYYSNEADKEQLYNILKNNIKNVSADEK